MPHTLLLADDSVTIQRVIELTFADEDVQVVAVGDGEQAIAILNARPPDIVLADVGMPKVDGYEVAQHVKSTPSLAHIPVVLLTGAFEPVDEARAATLGVDAVLAKPFEPQLVITKVKELLARPRLEPAIVETAPTAPEARPIVPAEQVAPVAVAQAVSIVEVVEVEPIEAAAPVTARVDDYFDRLDQAFASLAEGTTRQAADAVRAVGDEPRSALSAGSQALANGVADEAAEDLADRPVPAAGMGDEAGGRSASRSLMPLPTLSEAFAALLDAEQAGPSPEARPLWPAASKAAVAPEELVARVTQDVLQRLSDRVVRETVADIVSTVAERMVRDEIDRIKASIRA